MSSGLDTSALRTSGLGKRYGRTWALRDCSLALPAGRIAALVGPNGAGKTTLLSLAVGLLRPTTGSVRILGADPMQGPEPLGRVGFVAQDTPLYPDFTAGELVTLGRKLNAGFDERLALDRLRQLEIPTDRAVETLSGGQRAQVALAIVLAKRPSLLLLDEPVASLDPLARREFLQALAGSVAEEGLTVVLSSHLLADLERLCDYLIVLSASHVQVLGAVDDLLAEHKVLVGPRRDPSYGGVLGTIVQEHHTERQSTLLVRTSEPVSDLLDGARRVAGGAGTRLPRPPGRGRAAGPGPADRRWRGVEVIWLTWRQHRGQILVLAVGLLVLGALLLLTGRPMHDAFADTGLDGCLRTQGDPAFVPVTGEGGCIELAEAFASRFFNERLLALVAFILLPVMAGMFLGAPVVARELEQERTNSCGPRA